MRGKLARQIPGRDQEMANRRMSNRPREIFLEKVVQIPTGALTMEGLPETIPFTNTTLRSRGKGFYKLMKKVFKPRG